MKEKNSSIQFIFLIEGKLESPLIVFLTGVCMKYGNTITSIVNFYLFHYQIWVGLAFHESYREAQISQDSLECNEYKWKDSNTSHVELKFWVHILRTFLKNNKHFNWIGWERRTKASLFHWGQSSLEAARLHLSPEWKQRPHVAFGVRRKISCYNLLLVTVATRVVLQRRHANLEVLIFKKVLSITRKPL